MPGDIFTNSIISSISETFGHGSGSCIALKLGPKSGMTFAFSIAAASAALLWLSNANEWLGPVPVSILAGKFGTGAAFAMLYMSTLQFFPNQYMGRVFGTCNVTARLMTVMSPMVAEAPDPTPELVMLASCAIAAILTRFLKRPKELDIADEAKAEQGIELAQHTVGD